jgi:hypothetical protein
MRYGEPNEKNLLRFNSRPRLCAERLKPPFSLAKQARAGKGVEPILSMRKHRTDVLF